MTNPVPPEEPDPAFERAFLTRWTSANNATFYRYLVPHERLVIATRQHPAVLLGPGALLLAFSVATAVLSHLIPNAERNLSLALVAAWLVLILRTLLKIYSWAVGCFVITSERMLSVTGVLTRTISSIPFTLVDDIGIRRSLGGRLFGYAEFVVRSGHQSQVRQRIQYIAFPDALARKMREQRFPPEWPDLPGLPP